MRIALQQRTIFVGVISILAAWILFSVIFPSEKFSHDDDESSGSPNSQVVLRSSYSQEKLEGKLPSLSHYIESSGQLKKQNAQDLLHFTVLGFPKTGTTFLAGSWLPSHPNICMPPGEIYTWKTKNPPAETARVMHQLANGTECIRGYKAPGQVRDKVALEMLSTWWPKAKLIVGVRHPVTWFESIYNYRSQMRPLPPAEKLRGGVCRLNVCTDNGYFHIFLSYFGKTDLTTDREISLLTGSSKEWKRENVLSPKIPNDIFILETSQLNAAKQPDIFEALRLDLSQFLGLGSYPIPRREDATKEGYNDRSFDICEDRYKDLRAELVEIGTKAADWILQYFTKSPGVTVSSPVYFEQKLKEWHIDPCTTRSLVVNITRAE